MTSLGKKSANWTSKEDDKLLDLLIEQRAKGMIKFDWTSLRAVLRNYGIDKDATQIKNHFTDLGKKLPAWEFLIGRIGVGVDTITGAVVVKDDVGDEFMQRYGGKFKLFRKRVPPNVEKLKIAFYGRHATGGMSFAPGMVASYSNVDERMKGLEVDAREHVGDSHDGDGGGTPDDVGFIPPDENCSPPKTMLCGMKWKSGGEMSSGGKRPACGGCSVMDEEVSNALYILRMREEARQGPSLSQQVSARLRNHPDIGYKHPDFIFRILDRIVTDKQEQYFLGLDEDFVVPYVRFRGFDIELNNCMRLH